GVGLVALSARTYDRPMHWPVGHVTFQKIAYVATVSGIPTGLDYSRGPFGPFSPDVKKMISRLANNGLIIEQQLGRMIQLRPGSTSEDARRAFNETIQYWEPILDRVVDRFVQMRTTNQAEIAAT